MCVGVQGLVDPATGELYYMSHITSASLWEKRNETLRSEAELRRLVVPRLDNEYRGEVSACYSGSRDLARDPAWSPYCVLIPEYRRRLFLSKRWRSFLGTRGSWSFACCDIELRSVRNHSPPSVHHRVMMRAGDVPTHHVAVPAPGA
jgi:hypothetical protein